VAAARRAIGDFLSATGVADRTEITEAPATPGWARVKWTLPATPPRVTLIVPTRNRGDLLRRCAEGVLRRTDYPDLELIIMDNDSDEAETLALFERLKQDARVRVVPFRGAFNYSAVNNAAARVATGDILVLLNNDVDVIGGDWLQELVSHAVRPDVGAVGARLLFPDDTVQHAGVVLGVGSFAGGPGVAGHFGLHAPASDIGYFGQTGLTREVSAATGACLALRKSVYDSVGGLDEENLPIAFNDVDLCLRIRASGLRIIFTPYATLYHLESASRGSDVDGVKARRFNREARMMRARWGRQLDNDPFYNANFSRYLGGFQLAVPARRSPRWRRDQATSTFDPNDIVDG
jgi:GT2 family glycosyltransferase